MNKDKAQALVEDVEYGSRHAKGWQAYLVPFIAGLWSLFQFCLPKFILLDSLTVRAVHLSFAIVLVYLSFPALKETGWFARLGFRQLRISKIFFEKSKIPWIDFVLAITACVCALYYVFRFEEIGMRQGFLSTEDLVFGSVLLVLLLEAARRGLGLALPLIAGGFIVYSFLSEYMPALVSFKNASLSKVLNKLVFSTEGVFGVPLDVSASVVFLFVLFGATLERAGGGKYFIDLAFSLLGRFKGGPGKAAVLASGLTGIVSGSSIANTVTTGTFTIPLMKKAGYPAVKAGAIEVAASTNGQLMPPIMGAAAFIIAEYCNISYFEVVRAAIVPALISYIALLFITHLEASRLDLKPLPKEDLPDFWPTFRSGVHFLIPILFLLYQLMIERRSAELSAFYAIVSLLLLMMARNIWVSIANRKGYLWAITATVKDIAASFVLGGRNMMTIGVAVAAAGIVVGIVTLGLGGIITELIGVLSGGNLILLLVITAIASLVLGMGLPTTANYIVMATLTAPVIVHLGADLGLVVPLIAAHLFVFYFGILADDTPPVGLAAYAAAAISKADPIKTGLQGFAYDIRTAILPFMFIFNTDLLLIDVHHWWEVLLTFGTGVIAMLAFASLTQRYWITKANWFEMGLLALTTLILLRWDFFNSFYDFGKIPWKMIGMSVYGLCFLSQKVRSQA